MDTQTKIEITLKKRELEQLLLTIAGFSPEGVMVTGLLKEVLPLKDKRKLQKLHKVVMEPFKEFQKDKEDIKTAVGEDLNRFRVETEILLNEDISFPFEPISLAAIEEIKSSTNYNFDIIEKIAK